MLQILALIAPIFSLIALGFVAARFDYLGPEATRGLVGFGYKVAVPALLLRAMAAVGEVPVSPLLMLAAYACGIAATWTLASLATRFVLRRPADDAPSLAMGSCFGNGVMLGIPLILGAFGPEAAAPIAFLVSLETPVLWLLAMTHLALAQRGGNRLTAAGLAAIVTDIARNPIVVAIAAGLALRFTGTQIPASLDQILALLGQSAIPVSLFGLGMGLAQYEIKGQAPSVALVCLLTLVVYPAIAYVVAAKLIGLPPVWTGALVLFTAMPVGNNAFLFAVRAERAAASVSAAVAVSTPLAVLTVTAVLALLQAAGLPVVGR